MTAQALAGLFAGTTLVLLALYTLLWHHWRRSVRGAAELRETERNYHQGLERDAQERLERVRAELVARQADLAGAGVRLDACEARMAAQDLELTAHRASPLVGQTVVANTARPDDQSIRGVVVRELDGGGLLLAGAVYLDTAPGRGDVQERPAGDVVVHRVSWTQILHPEE